MQGSNGFLIHKNCIILNMNKDKVLTKTVKLSKKDFFIYKLSSFLFIYLLLFSFILICCKSLSPIYSSLFSNIQCDTSIFKYIGRSIAWDHKILYLEVFDHKGPYLFYLYALLYLLGGDIPIMMFFAFILTIDFYLVIAVLNQLSNINNFSKKITFYIFSTLYHLIILIAEFGRNEDLAATVGLFSLYSILKILNMHKQSKLNYTTEFILMLVNGIFIGIIFFMKFAALAASCGFALGFIVYLVLNKKWKSLGIDFGAVILGIFISAAPILLYSYTYSEEFFNQVIYATITYNFEYAELESSEEFICIILGILTLLLALVLFIKRKKIEKNYFIIFFVSTLFAAFYCFISKFTMYLVACLPIYLLSSLFVLNLIKFKKPLVKKTIYKYSPLFSSILVIGLLTNISLYYTYDFNACNDYVKFVSKNAEDKNYIKDGKNFLIIDTTGYYYEKRINGVLPVNSYNYFILQTKQMNTKNGNAKKEELMNYLSSDKRPEYLIINTQKIVTTNNNSSCYEIFTQINMFDENGNGKYYTLKDSTQINIFAQEPVTLNFYVKNSL